MNEEIEPASTQHTRRRGIREGTSYPKEDGLCPTLRYSASVSTRRLRTADYSQDMRERLADAVVAAREAMGHRYRPSFAKEAQISPRSLEAVEQAEPIVGAAVLRAIGRAVPTWTEDTARVILEGGPVPPAAPEPPIEPEESTPEVDDTTELDELRKLTAALRAQSTEALQLADRLTERIDRLGRLGDRRAQR